MPTIFSQLEKTTTLIQNKLCLYTPVEESYSFSWPNFVYTSPKFRRAHLDIVDARETKKLYMMHLCIFPHIYDPSPIYGFDLIAGPSKVTGAFHDFSPCTEQHPLLDWFETRVKPYEWSRKRQLPDWAQEIFSSNMVAAGNIQSEQELSAILNLALESLDYYLENVGSFSDVDYTEAQNKYCRNQKRNPHTPKVMASLGLDPQEVSVFVDKCLFPEIPAVLI
jgi:hypothetical protein